MTAPGAVPDITALDAAAEAAEPTGKSMSQELAAVARASNERLAAEEAGQQPDTTGAEGTDQATAEAAAVAAAAAAGATTVSADELTEIESLLSEAGIDLGLKAAELPPDLHTAFQRFAQHALDTQERVLGRELTASESIQAVAEFKAQLEKSPDHLLLSMAVSNPQAFKKAVEVFQNMEQDERYAEIVKREIESETRLREAERRERLLGEDLRRRQAVQVEAATRRAARLLGVDAELAERYVARAVVATLAEGKQFDVTVVDGLVAELKPKTAATAPRTVSPTKQAAAAAAPTKPAAGMTPPAKGAAAGLEDGKASRLGSIGAALKAAFQRTQAAATRD